MKILNNQIIPFIIATMILFSGSALAIDFFGKKDEGIIWEVGKNIYLKYDEQDDSGFGQNEHPVELNETEISKALELLIIPGDDRDGIDAVFTPQQISLLSRNLAMGLAKAKVDQDIIFSVKRSAKRLFGLKSQQFFAAGRAFYKDEKLNIIIGDYDRARDEGYEAVYDPTHVGVVAYNFNHGRRTKKSGFDKIVAEVNGIQNMQQNGNRRDDWLVIDLQEASAARDHNIQSGKEGELARKRKELLEILGHDPAAVDSAAAYESKERRRKKEEMARRRKELQEGGAVSSSMPSATDLEERLSVLKTLKAKGLVTDEEYALKRKEILDTL